MLWNLKSLVVLSKFDTSLCCLLAFQLYERNDFDVTKKSEIDGSPQHVKLKRRSARSGFLEKGSNEIAFVTAREEIRVWKYYREEREIRLWRETEIGDLLVNKIVVTPQKFMIASSFNEEIKIFK